MVPFRHRNKQREKIGKLVCACVAWSNSYYNSQHNITVLIYRERERERVVVGWDSFFLCLFNFRVSSLVSIAKLNFCTNIFPFKPVKHSLLALKLHLNKILKYLSSLTVYSYLNTQFFFYFSQIFFNCIIQL